MKYQITDHDGLVINVDLGARWLRYYGLHKGDEVETPIGTGKAVGVVHTYFNRTSFTSEAGGVSYQIAAEVDGEIINVPWNEAGMHVRIGDKEARRYLHARQFGRVLVRVKSRWTTDEVEDLYIRKW